MCQEARAGRRLKTDSASLPGGSGDGRPRVSRWRAKGVLAVAAAALGLLAVVGVIVTNWPHGASPSHAAEARRLLIPARGDLFGAWVQPTGGSGTEAEAAAVVGLQKALGRKLAIDKFYPGNAYVDWIGADGYNWYPARPGAKWASFGQIFSAFYHWGLPTGKPLIVSEFGVLEGTPGAKAGWFAPAERQLRTQLPAIRAVLYYFDSDDRQFDWKVTTSSSALGAFRSFARAAYFSARPST